MSIMLINNDLSDWLWLLHFDLPRAAVFKIAVLSVAHHDVEGGTVNMEQNADNLVVEIQLLFGGVLVILNAKYFAWSYMRSESSF